jgi:glycosyltransferase involved in cell wall biosynthesis
MKIENQHQRVIVMLGIHPASVQRGGISSVVDVYRDHGLFDRWPIHYIGTVMSGSALKKTKVFLAAWFEFLKLLLTGRVAGVHAHTASRASFWRKSAFLLAASFAGRPVILHLHGGKFVDFYRKECGPGRRALIRFVLRRADRTVVLASQWERALQQIAPGVRTTVIFNPVAVAPIKPANRVDEARNHAVEQTHRHAVLFLGRLSEAKGFFDLLRAIAVVKQRYPDVQLRCGGIGDTKAIQAALRELDIEANVVLLGWIEGQDKARELANAAVYVLPSYAEGLPMGVLEAMVAGKAVVASTVGGTPDAIEDGRSGFLIAPGDVDSLVDRLLRLLTDGNLRDQFGAIARLRAREHFSCETVLGQVEELYRSLRLQPRRPKSNESLAASQQVNCEV